MVTKFLLRQVPWFASYWLRSCPVPRLTRRLGTRQGYGPGLEATSLNTTYNLCALLSPVFKAPPAMAIADMSTIRAYRFVASGDTHMNKVATRQDSDITRSLLNLSYSHPPTMLPVKYPTDRDVKIYDMFSSLLFV